MKKQDIYKILGKYFDNYQISQILQKQTGLSKSQLFLCKSIDTINEWSLHTLISQWEEKYPFEYIIQKAEFYWFEFFVDERVLIPRNDTEIMVEQAIKSINSSKNTVNYLDIWTWSSCIHISVINNVNNEKIKQNFVIDISSEALEVSKINIEAYNLSNKVTQLHGDLFTPAKEVINSDDLIITANLPYIKNNDYENMDNETLQFEPDLALYGWKETWFELYEVLIDQLIQTKEINHINNITLFIEIWFDQEKYSQKYLNSLWLHFELFKDNGWIIRCIKVKI